MSFEEIVYGQTVARMHKGRGTKCDHKSLPCHYVTGGLKIQTFSPQPKDATDEIWAQFRLWCQRRCCLKVLTMTDNDEDNGELSYKLFGSLLF